MRNAPSRSCKEAVVTTTASSRPPVSTAPCRVRPVISFPPSYWLLSVGTVSAARRAHSITAAVGTGPRPIGRTRPPPDTGAGAVDEGGSVVVAVPAEGLHRGRAGGALRHGPAGRTPGGVPVGVRAPGPADRRAMPVVMVSSVVSRAGQRRTTSYDGHLNRPATRPNSSRRGASAVGHTSP